MTRRFDERVTALPDDARVTALDRRPPDPNFLRLEVAGREVARLDDTTIESLGLAVGDAWTDELAGRVRAALQRESARRLALAALGRRGLTRREIVDRLSRKAFDADVAEAVADDLAAAGWIDDAACAEETCRTILERGPATPALLVERMTRRGIEPELARSTAERALAGVDQVEAAVALARRQLARCAGIPRAGRVRRVASALARRGFDEQVVETAVHRLGLEPD